jgi:hypothetical protein
MTTESTALATVHQNAIARHTGPIRPVVRPAEIIAAHKEAAEVIRDALEDGRDYGRIPGAGDRKVLLKAGSERLCVAFGLQPRFEIVESEADHDREVEYTDRYKKPAQSRGLYRYVIRCLLEREGVVVGEGLGSCSTMEQKYVSRPRDCENTALKMAKKRAQVDAVLSTLSLSDRFTQDVLDVDEREEMPRGPRLDKDTLVAEVRALYDALKVAETERSKQTQVILGRRPDSLQDLVTVRDVLREELEAKNKKTDDVDVVDAEVVDDAAE